ncbi:MAG: GNAT family N-acetyltransferase [Flavobacterium sp.]|nr:MAG: GNAT family N-acetyltransferase [Flavobacterium sp.]
MELIKEISASATYAVRHPVLRPGKPIDSCHFEGDDLQSTHHFGLFTAGTLAGVVSIFEALNALFETPNQLQLRGMAVLPSFQNKGFGHKLVDKCEEFIAGKGGALLWFNARILAVPFYRKLGYEIIGAEFEIAGVGPHYVMYKTITS